MTSHDPASPRLASVAAGETRMVQQPGWYRGTIRAPGLHWVALPVTAEMVTR